MTTPSNSTLTPIGRQQKSSPPSKEAKDQRALARAAQRGPLTREGKTKTDSPGELVRLGCVLLRILIAWATSETAAQLGKRLALISRGAFLPANGQGDTFTIAGLMNISKARLHAQLDKNRIPRTKPGRRHLYRFADVAVRTEVEA